MSALLYWTCGKEMADMLLANGDAKEAEKLIRSQIADFKYKFSKNQDVWASTYYAIYNEAIPIENDNYSCRNNIESRQVTIVHNREFYIRFFSSECEAVTDPKIKYKTIPVIDEWRGINRITSFLTQSIMNNMKGFNHAF